MYFEATFRESIRKEIQKKPPVKFDTKSVTPESMFKREAINNVRVVPGNHPIVCIPKTRMRIFDSIQGGREYIEPSKIQVANGLTPHPVIDCVVFKQVLVKAIVHHCQRTKSVHPDATVHVVIPKHTSPDIKTCHSWNLRIGRKCTVGWIHDDKGLIP